MSAAPGRRYRYQQRRHRGRSGRAARPERSLMAWQNVVSGIAVTVICATAIAAIWILANREIHQQRAQTLARAEAVVTGQANILAEAVRQEMDVIDQSLAILRQAWDSDPAGFSLKAWQSKMPAITSVAKDIFIANNKGVIVQDVLPQAVGQGVGSAYADLGYGSLESVLADNRAPPHPGLVVTEKETGGVVRRYMMYVLRPLAKPAGWWIGASYRSEAVVKVFAEGSLGPRGIAALIDTRLGGIQAVAGPAALKPRANIRGTAMYKGIDGQKTDSGIWIGRTPMDNQVRIDAYRRIPSRGLIVVTGVDQADWMAPLSIWARNIHAVAGLGSLLVVGFGGLLLWWLWRLDSNRRTRFALEQSEYRRNSAQSGLQIAELAAQTSLAQVRAMMVGSSDGVALFDAEWHLTAWNAPFAERAGLPAGFLREGRSVDEIFRQQAQIGLLGASRDIEAEITQRLSQLRANQELVGFTQYAPDGRTLTVRGCSTPDGGMMLIVSGAGLPAQAQRQLPPPSEPAVEPEQAEEPPVEW